MSSYDFINYPQLNNCVNKVCLCSLSHDLEWMTCLFPDEYNDWKQTGKPLNSIKSILILSFSIYFVLPFSLYFFLSFFFSFLLILVRKQTGENVSEIN